MPPTALNNGEYVELLLGRIAAPYFAIDDFDDLPTPFRTVAVDLLSAQPVVMRSGSLADAMRATMSLPLIFPAMEIDGHVLIDGGTMNNVPADIVKAMGADRVVAVNVGDLSDRDSVSATMLGVGGEYARRHDACLDQARDRVGGRGHQCAGTDVWIARLAPRRRAHRRGLQRRRGDARPAAATCRERRGVRGMAPGPAGPPTNRTAGAYVHPGRRLRHEGLAAVDALLGRHVGVPLDITAIESDVVGRGGTRPLRNRDLAVDPRPARGYGFACWLASSRMRRRS